MPSPTYTLIQSTTLASNTASVDFNNISQSYYDLRLHFSVAVTGSGDADLPMTLNATSGNYRTIILYPNSATTFTGYGVGYTGSPNYANIVWAVGGNIPGAARSGLYSNGTTIIPGYRNTTNLLYRAVGSENGTAINSPGNWYTLAGAQWGQSTAVSRLTFTLSAGYGLIAAGSTLSLYGCTNS